EQHGAAVESSLRDLQVDHFRVIEDPNVPFRRRGVVSIEKSFAATEKKCVCAVEMQSATERALESDSVLLHPGGALPGSADGHARELLVGLAAGDAHEVGKIFV